MHFLLALLFATTCWSQSASLRYVKMDDWRSTWDASWEASNRLSGVEFGPWQYIGPFDNTNRNGFDNAFPPEQTLDLSATYTGKNGQEIRWQSGDRFRDGEVNDLRIFNDNDDIALYITRKITAEEATVITGLFGCDDGLKVWVNGKFIISDYAGRACMPDQYAVSLPLNKGENTLLLKIAQGGGPTGFYFAASGGGFGLGSWRVIGPFDNRNNQGFDAVYAPEKGIDFSATYDGKDGKQVAWQRKDTFTDGQINDLRIFDDSDEMAVYLHRTITSRDEAELPASFGSDDGMKVWLNGKLVVSANTTRAAAADQDVVALPLHKGENDLLIKVTQGGGPTAFYFSPRAQAGLEESLTARLVKDFPQAAFQIQLERDWMRQDEVKTPEGPFIDAMVRTLTGTKALLDDLQATYGSQFLNIEAGKLNAIEKSQAELVAGVPSGKGDQWRDLYFNLHELRRSIALQNPALNFDSLLFTKHVPTTYSHMCDQYYGWYARPGGGLFMLDKLGKSFEVRDILGDKLPEGSVMMPSLSWDGQKIAFAYWQAKQDKPENQFYHVFTVNVDGTDLKQITAGEFDDFSPAWLPDGDLVFISTRRGGYGRCHGRPVPLYTLHRMKPDGSQIVRLSDNEANEWDPAVMDDGRIVYSRWDYVDRDAVNFQSLWTCWPDGSQPVSIYGNATKNPTANYQPRQIPGTHKVISTVAAHHSMTAGSIVSVDMWEGVEGMEPLKRLTPEVPFVESEGWPTKFSYTSPWPLAENYYIASFSFTPVLSQGMVNPPNQYGLYLIDAFGNRELLYRDPAISSMWPVPLKSRTRPPLLQARSGEDEKSEGKFLMMDVYRSMEGIKRGTIKALRVIQVIPKATPIAEDPPLGMSGQENGKYVLGTVPVEEDGSAFFKAPAHKPLLFQALDERGRAIQSMRTLTYIQEGQTMSCVGCHEHRNVSAPTQRPMAAKKGVQELTAAPDGSAPMSYPLLIQPILDENCARCHNSQRAAGDLDLSGELTAQFTRSYENLMNRPGLVHRWRSYNVEAVTLPFTSGALASQLTSILEEGHHGVELTPVEWDCLNTWMDANALFYGTYIHADQKLQQIGMRIDAPSLQ